MDDALFVRRFERVGDLLRDRHRLVEGDRAALDTLGEIFAFDQLHDQRAGRSRLFEAVDLCDVRVVERGERLGLALEPRDALGVGGKGVGEDLQGDVAIEPRVAREIHLTHTTFAQLREDAVRSNRIAYDHCVLVRATVDLAVAREDAAASGGGPPAPIGANPS